LFIYLFIVELTTVLYGLIMPEDEGNMMLCKVLSPLHDHTVSRLRPIERSVYNKCTATVTLCWYQVSWQLVCYWDRSCMNN